MKCDAVALTMTGHPEDQRGPCDQDRGHDGPHRHHVRGQLIHEWSSTSYRVEVRSPIVRDESWWTPDRDTGACTVVVAPDGVAAWMTVAALMKGRMHEAVVVCPGDDGVIRVGFCSPQPVAGDPLAYDQWRGVAVAGSVWAVATRVAEGRITRPVDDLSEPEQLSLL